MPGDGEGVMRILGTNPAVFTRPVRSLDVWEISVILDRYLSFWHCNTILLCKKYTHKDDIIEVDHQTAKKFYNVLRKCKVPLLGCILFWNSVSFRVSLPLNFDLF